jgi:nucleoside 2-deoxyribosyltransferase
MKKVYFACSVRGGRDDKDTYAQLVEYLREHSDVLTEFNVDKDLTPLGTPGATNVTYNRDMEMLQAADAMIAEVTTPSLGVGYEIAMAEQRDIPVLALYRPQPGKALSAMIDGSPKTQVAHYETIAEAKNAIGTFLTGLKI